MEKVVKSGTDKELKDLTKEEFKNIDVKDLETVKPAEKKIVLVGFDRVAGDMRKKIEKLARQKGISTFSVMGLPSRIGSPVYSGGMVGSPEILVEGLYNMARQRPEIKQLIKIVANALIESDLLEVTSVSKLHGEGKVSARLFNTLNNESITDLKQLTEYTYGEVLRFRNMGEKSGKDLIRLLDERNMEFKDFKEYKNKLGN